MSNKQKNTEDTTSNLREFFNPTMRMEIRHDFPDIIPLRNVNDVITALDLELKKQNTNLNEIKRINIAYPHKHPALFIGHHDRAIAHATRLTDQLKLIKPNIDWRIANEICETKHLNRSNNSDPINTLRAKQVYEIHSSENLTPPFLRSLKREFFIVIDHILEQGTTLANLISYISYNDGYVLGALSNKTIYHNTFKRTPSDIERVKKLKLSEKFESLALKSKEITLLAESFSKSAKKISPDNCLEFFESSINIHGLSLNTLTPVEAFYIKEYINKGNKFTTLIKKLNKTNPKQTKVF